MKKTPAKKPAGKKKAVSKKAGSKKIGTKKTPSKKATRKTPAPKKSGGNKPVAKKTLAKKTIAKKTATKKSLTKKSTAKKPASKKPASKKPAPKKIISKKPASKAPASKQAPAKQTAPAAKAAKPGAAITPSGPGGDQGKKSGRKGITIVSKRPKRRAKAKPVRRSFTPPGERLLGPNAPVRKPLIPSGPKAKARADSDTSAAGGVKKTPFKKRELNKYRNLLLAKRAELMGDVEQLESDALRSESGNLSSLPQHAADAGSDSYETTLSLNLAAADRRLIKEIDDALGRIEDKTYGLCEHTGRPINLARLDELPWARFSIEAARELERRGGF